KLLSVIASASFERGLNVDQTQEQLDAALKKISHFVHEAHEQNEEWVRAMVDIPNEKMVDVASDKSVEVFMLENERGSPYYSDALVMALADAGDAVTAPSEV
ncbi:hypothetical protein Tco_0495988, partial [Tanacetum coccineum]